MNMFVVPLLQDTTSYRKNNNVEWWSITRLLNVYQISKIYNFCESMYALVYHVLGLWVSYPTQIVLIYLPNAISVPTNILQT